MVRDQFFLHFRCSWKYYNIINHFNSSRFKKTETFLQNLFFFTQIWR